MTPKNILIVDDDDAATFGYTCYLSQLGYSVTTTDCLKEGLERLSEQPFDALVLDVRLPDGNALEVIPEIRKCYQNIRIFVASGLSDDVTAQAAISNGADRFLVKPLSIVDLCTEINHTLANQH